jgi:hypothetical protein
MKQFLPVLVAVVLPFSLAVFFLELGLMPNVWSAF